MNTGFISYTHDDNRWSGGQVKRIVEAVEGELSLCTGKTEHLWIDDDQRWGEDLEEGVEEALRSSQIFVPILTPAYFEHDWCRRELWTFGRKAADLGLSDLILPIYFKTVRKIEAESDEPIIRLASRPIREDWREMRHLASDSQPFRETAERMAERILEIRSRAEGSGDPVGGTGGSPAWMPPVGADRSTGASTKSDHVEGDDELAEDDGVVTHDEDSLTQLIGDAEQRMTELAPIMRAVASVQDEYTAQLNTAAATIRTNTQRGRGTAGMITADRMLRVGLQPIATRFEEVSSEYATKVLEVESFTSEALERISKLEDHSDFESFLSLVIDRAESAAHLVALATKQEQNTQPEWSKSLRPIIARLEAADRQLRDARAALANLGTKASDLFPSPENVSEG